jgi:hypothetical protein
MQDLDAALARATDAIARRNLGDATSLLSEARALLPDGVPLARARLEGTQAELAAADEDMVAAELGFALAYDLSVAAGGQSNAARWAGRLAAVLGERRRYGEAMRWHDRAIAHARRSGVAHNVAASAGQAMVTLRQAHRHRDGARLLVDAAESQVPPMPAATAVGLLEQARTVLDMSGDLLRAEQIDDRIDVLARHGWNGPAEERERVLHEVAASRQRHAARQAERTRPGTGPVPGAFAHYLVDMMGYFEREGRADGMEDVGHLMADIALARAGAGIATWQDWVEPWLPQRIVTDAIIATARAGRPARAMLLSQRWKASGDAVEKLRAAGPREVQARAEAVRAAGESALELGEELRRRDPTLAARLGAPVWPEDLVDLLPPSSPVAIVDLVVGHASSMLLIAFRRGDRVDVVGHDAVAFSARDAAELLQEWAGGQVAHEISERQRDALVRISSVLHDRMFCGLASSLARLRVTQVVLIPDLLVRHLPLHLAGVCDDNVREIREAVRMNPPVEQAAMFCDVFPVEYAACLQAVAVSAPQKRPRTVRAVLSMADPAGDLPGTRDTAAWLVEKLPAGIETMTRIGADATLRALERDLPRADIAILGCHGSFLPDRPLASHLSLSGGQWTVDAILGGAALERAPVLVLSACEVGARAPTVDEIEASGLPGALVSAGAGAVLASMWPVEDVSMGYLVERFVAALSHPGYRPAAALYRAVHQLQRCTLAEAIERIAGTMRRMEEDGTVETAAAQYLMLDTLRSRLADEGAPFPFASAQYWGGVVVVGSGWYQPADGVVTSDPVAVIEATFERTRARDMIRAGDVAAAQPILERLLDLVQGSQRVEALVELGEIAWRGRADGCARSARRAARRYLERARAAAHGIHDRELAARIAAAETETQPGGAEDV